MHDNGSINNQSIIWYYEFSTQKTEYWFQQWEKYKSHFTSDDAALDYLASILIEGF